MTKTAKAGRQHRMVHGTGVSRIEIEEPYGSAGRWLVNLEAKRTGDTVDVRIIDHLVVQFTPQEARDFAEALARVAKG